MNLSRWLFEKALVSIVMAAWLLSIGALASDTLDSQLRDAISQKVVSDHAQDVKAGKFAKRSGREPASVQAIQVAAGSATFAPPTAAHPTQIQQLQKKATTPAPAPKVGTKAGK